MQKKVFLNFNSLILQGSKTNFMGGGGAASDSLFFSNSKTTPHRELILVSNESEISISYLSLIHFISLSPWKFELIQKINKKQKFCGIFAVQETETRRFEKFISNKYA